MLKKLWEAITFPFITLAVFIDEDRRQNLDGQWDNFNKKRNERMMRRKKGRN